MMELIENLGTLMSRLGDLRKCSALQLMILFGGTIAAAGGTYQFKHDWIEAAGVGVATFVGQLPHIYAPPPSRSDQSKSDVEDAKGDVRTSTAKVDADHGN